MIEAFLGVVAGDPSAGDAFYRAVQAHPSLNKVAPTVRDDVLQDVAAHFLTHAPEIAQRLASRNPAIADHLAGRPVNPAAWTQARGSFKAYVGTSIRNRGKSLLKTRQTTEWNDDLAAPVEEDAEGLMAQAHALLDRLEAEVLEDHPDGAETLRQLRALATGEVTMHALVDDELARTGDTSARTTRERLYKRHTRMREALKTAVNRMARRGELDTDAIEMATRLLDGWLRRRRVQSGPRGPSKPSEET